MSLDKESKKQKILIEVLAVNEKDNNVQARQIMKIIYEQDYGGGIATPMLKYKEEIEQELLKKLKEDKVISVMVEDGVITEIEPKDC